MAVVAAQKSPDLRTRRPGAGTSEYCIELGLVNNMPDSALDRTERQFFHLLGAAAPDLLVRVHFFSLSGLMRSAAGLDHLERSAYRGLSDLLDADLDALIVTGTEPRQADLRAEACWAELTVLFDWVAREGPSTMFSCLAAHAAVLHYDGIERRRLTPKRFGTFDHEVVGRHPFTKSLAEPLKVAHSRWNEVGEEALKEAGYEILTRSREGGVDMFVRPARHLLLFCQGHPEYDPSTLGREYQRDVRRFLTRESAGYPNLPHGYFDPAETLLLARFQARAQARPDDALLLSFPVLRRRLESDWYPPTAAAFRAWLERIVESKREARPRLLPLPNRELSRAS